MTDGLVIRLLRVASYMNDIGETGYEVETVNEAAVRIDAMLTSLHEVSTRCEQLETALRKCHTALEVAFDYDGDDVFGMMHNDAVDASMEAERLLGIKP